MGPGILASIGVGVWRKAPETFPDSNTTLDTCQSENMGREANAGEQQKEGECKSPFLELVDPVVAGPTAQDNDKRNSVQISGPKKPRQPQT